MRTRIKLCGFQTEDTVHAATRAGADAVGFVFYPPSPRHIEVAQAGQLARCLGAWQTSPTAHREAETAKAHRG